MSLKYKILVCVSQGCDYLIKQQILLTFFSMAEHYHKPESLIPHFLGAFITNQSCGLVVRVSAA